MAKAFKRASTVKRIDRTDFESLKSNGFLDLQQAEAGDKFEALFYRSQFGVQAMDPAKPVIDGGKGYYDIPDHIIDCQNQLKNLARHLGMLNYTIMHKFIAEGRPAADVAPVFGYPTTDRGLRSIRMHFRVVLNDAALHFGIKHVERSSRSNYYWRDGIAQIIPEEWGPVLDTCPANDKSKA